MSLKAAALPNERNKTRIWLQSTSNGNKRAGKKVPARQFSVSVSIFHLPVDHDTLPHSPFALILCYKLYHFRLGNIMSKKAKRGKMRGDFSWENNFTFAVEKKVEEFLSNTKFICFVTRKRVDWELSALPHVKCNWAESWKLINFCLLSSTNSRVNNFILPRICCALPWSEFKEFSLIRGSLTI